jgi:hypothetical protein
MSKGPPIQRARGDATTCITQKGGGRWYVRLDRIPPDRGTRGSRDQRQPPPGVLSTSIALRDLPKASSCVVKGRSERAIRLPRIRSDQPDWPSGFFSGSAAIA